MRSLKNTRGGFLHFILMVVIIIVIMSFFDVSLNQVFDFIIQLINGIIGLLQTLLASIVSFGKSVGS